MGRLTKRISLGNGKFTVYFSNEKCGEFLTNHKAGVKALFEKLAEYEDLEEQGLLLKLPCKVGDTVYQITRNFISSYKIESFTNYNEGNIFFDWLLIDGIYINVSGFHINDIGKTVFLTKAEAEKALAEMEK